MTKDHEWGRSPPVDWAEVGDRPSMLHKLSRINPHHRVQNALRYRADLQKWQKTTKPSERSALSRLPPTKLGPIWSSPCDRDSPTAAHHHWVTDSAVELWADYTGAGRADFWLDGRSNGVAHVRAVVEAIAMLVKSERWDCIACGVEGNVSWGKAVLENYALHFQRTKTIYFQ